MKKKWSYFPQKQKDNKEKVHIPLSNAVLCLLKRQNDILVFSGYYYIMEIKGEKVMTEQLQDLHIHDLRRTYLH